MNKRGGTGDCFYESRTLLPWTLETKIFNYQERVLLAVTFACFVQNVACTLSEKNFKSPEAADVGYIMSAKELLSCFFKLIILPENLLHIRCRFLASFRPKTLQCLNFVNVSLPLHKLTHVLFPKCRKENTC